MDRRICLLLASGAWLAMRSVALAQPVERVVRIGTLRTSARPTSTTEPQLAYLRNALRELGYVEGRNLVLEERFAGGDLQRLPALARELVAARVEVIVAVTATAARAVREAAPATPVVFFGNFDPVAIGLVSDLARPGGMMTGILIAPDGTLAGKRIELLKAAVPQATRIGLLLSDEPSVHSQAQETGKAARALARWRIDEGQAASLPRCAPPAWVFLHAPLDSTSSTALRAKGRGLQWDNSSPATFTKD